MSKNYRVGEEQKRRIYFCPFCKLHYSSSQESFKYNSNTMKFRCIPCNSEYFNNSMHEALVKAMGHPPKRKYYLIKSSKNVDANANEKEKEKKSVEQHISNEILVLKKRGFSNADIHKITHYPRNKISAVILNEYTKSNVAMPIEEFFEEHLKLSAGLCAKIKEREPLDNDLKKELITKALLYGCTYDVIRQLLPIRREKITRIAQQTFNNLKAQNEIAISKVNKKIEIISDESVQRVKITTLEKK